MQRPAFHFGPGCFRLTLASFVVFSHLTAFEVGGPSVMLFFMLSGYWVLRMYEQKYRPKRSIWLFYLSRAMRIWGPFFVAFVGVFLLFYMSSEPKPTRILMGLGLLGIATNKLDLLGISWSLDLEMQFYLMVPAISFLLSLCVRRAHFLVAGLCVIGLTGLGWHLQDAYGVRTMLNYLPLFFTGALIWVLKPASSARMAMISLAVFVAVAAVVLAIPYLRPLLRYGDPVPFPQIWFNLAWVLLLVPFVIRNLQQKSTALDMHFGNYSYALYITHWPVIVFWRMYVGPIEAIDKLMVLVAIAAVSTLFYLAIDRPLERFRIYVMGRF